MKKPPKKTRRRALPAADRNGAAAWETARADLAGELRATRKRARVLERVLRLLPKP